MISAWEEERNNGTFAFFSCPCCSPEYCRWNKSEDLYPGTFSKEMHLRLAQVSMTFMNKIRRTR